MKDPVKELQRIAEEIWTLSLADAEELLTAADYIKAMEVRYSNLYAKLEEKEQELKCLRQDLELAVNRANVLDHERTQRHYGSYRPQIPEHLLKRAQAARDKVAGIKRDTTPPPITEADWQTWW